MSENESGKQVKEMKCEDCLAMKWGWFNTLESLWFRAVLTALPAVIIVSAIFTWVQMIDNATPSTLPTGIMYLAGLALPIWLIMFLMSVAIWHEPFTEYWRRNIVGYTMVLFIAEDGMDIDCHTFYGRRVLKAYEGVLAYWLTLPLGGWFRRPIYHQYGHDFWRLKMAIPYHRLVSQDYDRAVYLYDTFDNRLRLQPQAALKIASQFPSIPIALEKTGPDLAEMNRRLDAIAGAACETVQEIIASSRFGHSKEGRAIRIRLAKEVIAALPEGDLRINSLQQTLGKVVAKHQPNNSQAEAV